ncbi:serine protease inhibitor Kazal-type 1 [Vulpes vulpes]|uniref:Serine protease inhibitor Kazal-type 1 n=2 Tax=Canidae TaxID=9608 RepID=A0A3Q7R004_VULVU|nr:serine protease inhibitor Kazal-type 1 [Vulpes vulpes]XP_041621089.1 serine protease inhibitor Kazal-type 1 [Vulpes lagopus]XP_055188352.1 serine protease inhibitor Kazal-type 1 [Nyctereutes procyonoides]CAD7678875.1 unnamed protein product [Nyctereutes procyonoides]
MKVTSIFLLSALALLSLSGNTRANNMLQRQANCNLKVNGCNKIYNPICGSDGITYANECLLCLENKKRQTSILVEKSGPC